MRLMVRVFFGEILSLEKIYSSSLETEAGIHLFVERGALSSVERFDR